MIRRIHVGACVTAALSMPGVVAALGADPMVHRRLADLYARTGRAPDAARARLRYEAALVGGSTPR